MAGPGTKYKKASKLYPRAKETAYGKPQSLIMNHKKTQEPRQGPFREITEPEAGPGHTGT